MKKIFLTTVLALGFLVPFTLAAQSNEVLDVFLARAEADFGTSAYLILADCEKITDTASVDEAMNWIGQSENLNKLKDLNPDRTISYGEFSYIMMEVLELKGGLMYSLVPGPRYAAREAAYKRWIIGKSSPGRGLKPFEVINALVTILEKEGAR
ncbi:hypothetical protein [Oceanispirochaeta sp.]|jgi:hypothetical protein|uniref:hypothetical protein n=1 Tax=Oceanispirochaeta sp. TaxID=2035350 RepID=UPI00260C97EE|nr:hypothetical protein [Oceanispirochaeta sp.]MDA3957304.1 hypothetical protein [Oceanispirochaeta sp.]